MSARQLRLPAGSSEEALQEAWALLARYVAFAQEMLSPDGQHRALRSVYSRRGACEVYRAGEHSPACTELFDLLEATADAYDRWEGKG